MKTDQDLIFEAYATTLNEGSHLYGDTELGPGKYKAKDVTITDYDIEGLTRDGVGGGYNMVPVEFEDDNGTTMTGIVDSLYIDDIRGGLDASGMIHDAEVGTLEEDGESSVSKYYKQAYDYAKENPGVSSFQVNPYEEFSDEYLEFEDGFEDGMATHREEDDNDEYAPEEAPADDQALDIAPEEDDNVADDYPDHQQILSNIREIVDENIGYGEGREHSRETLDDIIDDLVRYRNGLPSTDDYMKGGKL